MNGRGRGDYTQQTGNGDNTVNWRQIGMPRLYNKGIQQGLRFVVMVTQQLEANTNQIKLVSEIDLSTALMSFTPLKLLHRFPQPE